MIRLVSPLNALTQDRDVTIAQEVLHYQCDILYSIRQRRTPRRDIIQPSIRRDRQRIASKFPERGSKRYSEHINKELMHKSRSVRKLVGLMWLLRAAVKWRAEFIGHKRL